MHVLKDWGSGPLGVGDNLQLHSTFLFLTSTILKLCCLAFTGHFCFLVSLDFSVMFAKHLEMADQGG